MSRHQGSEAMVLRHTVCEQITARLIELLEQGVVPWKSPYLSKVGFPRNFVSGKPYRGINVFLLGSLRYTSPYFLTFIQAKELGGNVRRGEKGGMVVKYGIFTKATAGEGSEEPAEEEHRYLKTYTVFNASQIEGIDFPKAADLRELTATEKCNRAREIIAHMPKAPLIKVGTAVPHYCPETDSVHVPDPGYFESEEAYYSTLFHELTHATGHTTRLRRKSLLENKGIDSRGADRKVYAEEELTAEMGASFLNADAGIMDTEIANSAAYLQGWITALKSRDAKSWIMKAAAEAQKAADFILNLPPNS